MRQFLLRVLTILEHRFQAAAVFLLQVRQVVQATGDFRQAFRVVLDASCIVRKETGHFFDGIALGGHFIGLKAERFVHLYGVFQELFCRAQAIHDGVVALIEQGFQVDGGFDQSFGVGEQRSFLKKPLVFVRFRVCRGDFLNLKFEKFPAVAHAPGFGVGVFPLREQVRQTTVGDTDRFPEFAEAAEPVQKVDMTIRIKQRLVIVLSVKVDQGPGQVEQPPDGNGQTVDETAAATVRSDLPADDEFTVLGLDAHGVQKRQTAVIGLQLENGLDETPFLARPDHVRARPRSENQTQGADEDGFARAGFTRNDVQPGSEFDFNSVDQRVVDDQQAAEHVQDSRVSRRSRLQSSFRLSI